MTTRSLQIILRLYYRSLRWEVKGWRRLLRLRRRQIPLVFQVWHGEMLAAWYVMSFFKPAAIVSEHGDGAWAAAALEALHFTIFRGSSTRGGVRALKQLLEFLKTQRAPVAAFAADGPQGPRRELKAGTTAVAKHLSGKVIPFAVRASYGRRLNSWDRFLLPWPGSKVTVVIGPPLSPPSSWSLREQNQWLAAACRQHQEQVEQGSIVREHPWQHPCLLPLRVPLAGLYAALSFGYHKLYDAHWLKPKHLPRPVISVGNIEVGGTGKTVFVEALARLSLGLGLKPAILTRGYGRRSKAITIIAPHQSGNFTAEEVGDEALLLSHNLPEVPIVVGRDRYRAALQALPSLEIDLFLLDDGFQHRRLFRDIDLVLWSAPPEALRHFVPWGVLREAPAALARANLTIPINGEISGRLAPRLIVKPARNSQGESQPLGQFKGKAGAFAGIAHPEKFFKLLESQGVPVVKRFAFPDHCRYTIRRLEKLRRQRVHYWITTQKDFVKLPPEFRAEKPVWYVPIAFEFPPELKEKLKKLIAAVVDSPSVSASEFTGENSAQS